MTNTYHILVICDYKKIQLILKVNTMNAKTNDPDQYESDLEYVREKRKLVIDGMTKGGIPSDNRKVQTLLMALADMDRTTLSKKKIKVDKEIGSNNNQAMELIASMFGDSRLKKIGVTDKPVDRVLPELGPDISVPDIVDGETDEQPTQENYDSFMTRIS